MTHQLALDMAAPHAIADIGMRMLVARELFRCQGFPDSYLIDSSWECRLTCGHFRFSPGAGRYGIKRPPKQVRCLECETLEVPKGTRYTKAGA
jgi:hypothetical protein